jgi:hypothetical protein
MLATLCLLALFLPGMIGCGGCSSSSDRPGGLSEEEVEVRRRAAMLNDLEENPPPPPPKNVTAKAPSPPPPPKPPGSLSQEEETQARVKAAMQNDQEENPPPPPPKNATATGLPPSSKSPPKPTRPEEIADWKRDDYYSAQRDGDPRLVAAVAYLGRNFADQQSTAELLVKLLESSAKGTASFDPDDEGGTRGTNMRLVEALVAALAANRTPAARQTVERLVMATAKPAANRAVAVAVLKALCARSGPENEDLLFRVITAPEQRESAAGKASEPEKLRAAALGLAKSSASEAFRLRLAGYMAAPETPQTLCDQIWGCLNEPRAENLPAQIVLYQSDRLDEKAQELLEGQFAAWSRALLGRLLGFPASKERRPAPETAATTTDPYRMAGLLWGSDLTAAVERRLRAVDGLDQGARLVLLASTIPTQPMRAALLRTFEKHWEEGSKGLSASAAVENALQEPGFLLLVKRLPRKDATPPPGNARTSRTDSPQGSSAKAAKLAAERESKQRQEQAAQQWMTFSEGLMRASFQRFYAAALAQQPAGKRPAADNGAGDLPVKLPPNADIVASYRVDWPQRLGENLVGASLSPLRVRYVRVEQKAKPLMLLGYYRRQLPSCDEHVLKNAVWLDDFSIDKQQAGERSVDVWITRPNKGIPLALGQEQELIVEVLVVECEMTATKRFLSAGK